jgi:hypothetical protein
MRIVPFSLIVGAGIGLGSLTAAAQVTTRIETSPVYGATVTIEKGVRVYRPLPPHDRVIINPGGTTPLSIGIVDGGTYGPSANAGSNSGDRYLGGTTDAIGTFLPGANRQHGRHGGRTGRPGGIR